MKIEQVFNVCSVYSQRNYLISADYSNAYQSRGYPLRKKYSNNAIKIADNSEIAINGIEYLVKLRRCLYGHSSDEQKNQRNYG